VKLDFRQGNGPQPRQQFSLQQALGLTRLLALRTRLSSFEVLLVLLGGSGFEFSSGQLSDLITHAFDLTKRRFFTGAIGTVLVFGYKICEFGQLDLNLILEAAFGCDC